MYAHLGDRLIIETPSNGFDRRDGESICLHHHDGTPPSEPAMSARDTTRPVPP
ncbi:DUF1918 domain-containing protein [Streptomyces sp. SCL15-6]|jgi:hypothetical protein|uniref:DUF1918 domain-containing protein n=1 Tax=Streptomyces sp. SCL15-6 TaxID=2967222 RepID=UPI002966D5DD|nr:DUF1918 domain-containing protein [Streptomyces sp. SCL15-6]